MAPTIIAAPNSTNGITTLSVTSSHTVGVPSKAASLHSPGVLRRKGSISSKGANPAGIIKRTMSSPNIRGPSVVDSSTMSLAEKRRNKLGYHRTSVACGHCRKRKIRCLIAVDDAQGRCSNCIRLKKECKFYAVDQQPPTDRRPRSESKTESSSNDLDTPHSLSPGKAGGHVVDQVDHFRGYNSMPAPIDPEAGAYHGSFEHPSMSQVHGGAPQGMEYPQIYDNSSSWDTPYYNQSPLPIHTQKAPHDDLRNHYWRVNDSPATSAYSQTQYSVPQSAMSLPVTSDGGSEIWSPAAHPGRSMSLVQPEALPQHYQGNLREQTPGIKRRRTTPSDVIAPSIHDAMLYTSSGQDPPQSAPLAGPYGIGQEHSMHFPYQNTWEPFHQSAHQVMGPPTDRGQSWYPKSPLQSHLSQVKEDEPSTNFHSLHSQALPYDSVPGSAA